MPTRKQPVSVPSRKRKAISRPERMQRAALAWLIVGLVTLVLIVAVPWLAPFGARAMGFRFSVLPGMRRRVRAAASLERSYLGPRRTACPRRRFPPGRWIVGQRRRPLRRARRRFRQRRRRLQQRRRPFQRARRRLQQRRRPFQRACRCFQRACWRFRRGCGGLRRGCRGVESGADRTGCVFSDHFSGRAARRAFRRASPHFATTE